MTEFTGSSKIDLLLKLKASLGESSVQPSVEFKEIDGGVGVFATQSISPRQVLVQVPFSTCLSVESVLASPLRVVFDDNPGVLDYPDEVLAIGLLYALQEESCAWNLHVKTMPSAFNTPLYWEEADLENLKGSIVFHLVNMMKKRIASDWENLIEPLASNYPELIGKATHASYTWALSAIYSRAVEIIRNGSTVRCMPPLVDMANHDPHQASDEVPSLYYSAPDDSICLVASVDRSPGDEVFVIYGHYPNSKLLYSYGFVVDNNPNRAIDLWPRVPPSSYRAAEKEAILRSHPLTAEQTYDFRGTVRSNGYISPALLATVRIIAADESDMLEHSKAFDSEMISVRNEIAALRSLHGLLVARMQPDQSEGERKLLGELRLDESTDRSSPRYMSLVMRVEERELLQEVIALVLSWIESLEQTGSRPL